MNHPGVPQPHQPRRIGPNNVEKGVLRRLGQPGPRSGLGEGLLVEDPDADGGVLLGGGSAAAGLGGVEPPREARAGGPDLAEEVVVLEGFGSGDFLYGRRNGFFNHGGCLG